MDWARSGTDRYGVNLDTFWTPRYQPRTAGFYGRWRTRLSAIGKKNWLFIGQPVAGRRSAITYSLDVTCQRHGKVPLAYLSDGLARLPTLTSRDDLTPVTPAAWQPS